MRKVVVVQHEAYDLLGTLDPLLKKEGFRIKYINFERHPHAQPTIDKYDGLVILGGYMGVYEAEKYTHLKVEMKLIEEALKKEIPILGICLGSQILAHVLGAHVRKHKEREMGWYDVHLTDNGANDPLLGHFKKTEKVFQSHGDTFDIPDTAEHLAWSTLCEGQAFRYKKNVYGLQFHLEVDETIAHQWLHIPENIEIFENSNGTFIPERIKADTAQCISRSIELSTETFFRFTHLFQETDRSVTLKSKS